LNLQDDPGGDAGIDCLWFSKYLEYQEFLCLIGKPWRVRRNIISVSAGGFSGTHATVLSRFGPLCGYLEVTVGKKA